MFILTPKPDYKKIETEVLTFWKNKKIFARSISERPESKKFVFYEGPPTANGHPGIHHIIARAYKDIIPRYKTMRGFRVPRQAGWDTHGLPVELEVEKMLGISGKDKIESLTPTKRESIIKFNQLCKENVFKYQKEWERVTERIGYWIDMDNPYITFKNEYIEKLWGIIKIIWSKGFLYQDYKVLPYCFRCGTGLSSHEVAQEFKDKTDTSIFVKFKSASEENTFFLAWTTTPWTLPGNVALAVGKEIKYGKYQLETGKKIILAENLALKILGEKATKIDLFIGADLVGQKYEPIFNIEKTHKDQFTILPGDFVSTSEGSGIVHTAVMYGEDDFALSKKFNLPTIHTVDPKGNFTDQVKKLAGKNIFVANQIIIDDLKQRDLLFKELKITHSYPFCWRCHNPLIYYAKESWFIAMKKLRSQLVSNNEKINWIPTHLKHGRFGNWLDETKDWALSRDRYWATPLPVWRCHTGKSQISNLKSQNGNAKFHIKKNYCNHIEVIGSFQELVEKSTQPIDLSNFDPHRPFIDEIKLKCPKCSGAMEKDPAVIDCWFDSGAMPFASGASENIGFPADYISEAIDQTRGWFYTLLAISTLLGKGASYKNVICIGHIVDEHGKKMSKSLGNVLDPNLILDKFGADNLRFYLVSVNQPGLTKRFSEKELLTCVRKNLLVLWNITNYFLTYSRLDGWQFKNLPPSHFLDLWLASRVAKLKNGIVSNLDNYEITTAANLIESFLDEFSTWYLKLSRKRRTQDFYDSFYLALKEVIMLIAPFMPFVCEFLFQNLKDEHDADSIHLEIISQSKSFDEKIIQKNEWLKKVISQASSLRQEKGIRLRQPLAKLELRGKSIKLSTEELEILKTETNVLNVELCQGKGAEIILDTQITPQLKYLGTLRDIKRQIQNLRKNTQCQLSDVVEIMIEIKDFPLEKFKSEIEKETKARILSTIESPDNEFKSPEFSLYLKK